MEMSDNGAKKSGRDTYYVVNKALDAPPPRTGFKNFLYNPDTGEYLGRTPFAWLQLLVFYIIFYICLALFAFAMFWMFWKLTISLDKPRWIGAQSLIGTNPGVGFRPMPDQDDNVESTLIWINLEVEEEKSFWSTKLEEYFSEHYKKSQDAKKCTFGNGQKTDSQNYCDVDIDSFGPCKPGSGFGYLNREGAPCVLVKLNKIYDWYPQMYESEGQLPEGMPERLKTHIKTLIKDSKPELQSVWFTCEGENPADREHIGPIEYYNPGETKPNDLGFIPAFYYPYQNQKGYESPFVFLRFVKPSRGSLIQVECKAWARNIEHNRQFRLGSVHFEFIIDT